MSTVAERRADFRPPIVTTLFVGESVPNGGTFFYDGNSNLFNAMRTAFDLGDDFLEEFEAQGFFLDDLVPDPVNKIERRERQLLRIGSIPSLAERILEYKPCAVVVVMCAIRGMVERAVAMSGISCPIYCTPFPAFGNQKKFQQAMKAIIPNLPTITERFPKGFRIEQREA